jgi:hypothetical protein
VRNDLHFANELCGRVIISVSSISISNMGLAGAHLQQYMLSRRVGVRANREAGARRVRCGGVALVR